MSVDAARPAEVLTIRRSRRDGAEGNLTRAQYLMWLGQSLNPDVPLYNMIHTHRISGALDPNLFAAAWQDVVDGNDALRSTVEDRDGAPHMRVHESMDGGVTHVDLSGHDDPDAAFAQWVEARRVEVYDLSRRVFDSALVRLGPESHVWYLGMHHLASDAASFALTYERTAEAYARREAGDTPLPAGPSYADHRDRLAADDDTERRDRARIYWNDRIDHDPEPTSFYGRTIAGSPRTVRRVVHLDDARSAAVRALAADDRFQVLSEEMTLHAIWSALLSATIHRVAGVDDVRLGSPFAARMGPVDRSTIGVFTEVGVLTSPIADRSFPEIVKRFGREIFGGLRHAVAGSSSAELNRSYDVLVNNVTARMGDFAGRPMELDWVHTGFGDPDHALRVQITDFNASGSFALHLDMNADVFDDDRRSWFEQHLLAVLDAVLADPEVAVGDIDLSDEALVAHRETFNATDAPGPGGTVLDTIRSVADQQPDEPAVVTRDATTSYGELLAAADALAGRLLDAGVERGDRVAIHLPRSTEAVVAMLGSMIVGAPYIPVEVGDPDARLRALLEDAAPAAVIGDAAHIAPAGIPVLDVSIDARLDAPLAVCRPKPDDVAYLIFTSGSTGRPKGALLTHGGLQNYVHWAAEQYADGRPRDFALHSSLAFDLTITSVFVPLVTGGAIRVYEPSAGRAGLEVLDVFEDDLVDVVKLTPAHLALVAEAGLTADRISTLIVGGENFRTDVARGALDVLGQDAAIFNEYGPTETVVGCMIHRFDPATDTGASVPIGTPAANARIHLLDEHDRPVARGVVGEMVVGGAGVGLGYHARPELSAEKFGPDPLEPGGRIYRTGDLAYWDADGQMVFLGRADDQVKINGTRIELGEVEAALLDVDGVESVVVDVIAPTLPTEVGHCVVCGLPSNYPTADFDEHDVCGDCRAYERHRLDVERYWSTPEELTRVAGVLRERGADTAYDCIVMLSGGKDSTYMLYQVVREYGLNPLVFTLDNGYISEEALDNCRRACADLGVDLHMASTPHMNAIFVDSLERHSNVCNGCFKTIYTLSMDLAHEHGIDTIVTGLARGQLFETRLADTFKVREFDPDRIDDWIMEARKAYHHIDDAVYQLLDTSLLTDEHAFDHIRYVDFYRYVDVPLSEVYEYLDAHTVWERPSDTGRSTNCLINDAGIFVHQRKEGFHNYALPYSWDVRLGHKTRDAAMWELNDDLDEVRVRQILDEIGYTEDVERRPRDARLVAYVVGADATTVRAQLAERLPAAMVPTFVVEIDELPLTRNGKIDRAALPDPQQRNATVRAVEHEAPRAGVETTLAAAWAEVFELDDIGRHDNFFDLGGDSITAVRLVALVRRHGVQLSARDIFDRQTIAELAPRVDVATTAAALDGALEDPAVLDAVRRGLGADEPRLDYAIDCNPTQVGMLYHSLRDPDGAVYQQQVTAELHADVDLDLLRQAFGAAVARHDALRSRFVWRDLESPVQAVLAAGDDDLRFVVDPAEPQRIRPEALDAAAPFVVEIHTGGETPTMVLRSHHVALDGWSSQQILREVEVDHDRLRRGLEVSDHRPPQLREHAGWRRGRDPERGVAHYTRRLADLPPKPALPGLLPETAEHRGVWERRWLSAELVERLRDLAAEERLTVNTLIQGAWGLVLGRWLRTDDVVFGSTVAGRPEDLDGVDQIVGMFINTLPSRVVFDARQPVLSSLRTLQADEIAARSFSDTSLADIQRSLGDRDSLFDSLVVFESVPGRDDAVPALFGEPEYREQSNFPLALLVFPDDEIELRAVVNTARLDPADVAPMLDAMATVLAQLADDRTVTPDRLRLLGDETEATVRSLSAGPSGAEAEPSTLADELESWMRTTPEATAIAGHDVSLSWAELDTISSSAAAALHAHGIGPGSVVGVDATLAVDSIVAAVAVVRAGAAYVALDPDAPEARLASIIDAAGIDVVLGDAPTGDRPLARVVIDRGATDSVQLPEVSPTDHAYVIFTSGSTGVPKGVPVRNEQIVGSTRARAHVYGTGPERFLLVSSLAFDSSMVGLWWTLTTGGTIVLRDPGLRGDLRHTVGRIEAAEVTDVLALPSLYSAVLETTTPAALASLRRVIVAGEACSADLVAEHRTVLPGVSLHNEYGPSEGTVWSHVARLDDRSDALVPIGRPLVDTVGAVVDHHGARLPVGVPGELALQGPGVVDGYLGDPERTSETFHDGLGGDAGRWYRTGDLVAMDAHGDLSFLGRVDNQVKVRGQRVEIEEVEAVLIGLDGVAGAGVRVVDAGGRRERLVGYVTALDGALDTEMLRSGAARHLTAAAVPAQIVVLDELPTTGTGKLDRAGLPEVDLAAPTERVAPRTELEHRLAALWAKILRADDIGIDDDFFDLGGHSLAALRLFADLSSMPGGDLPLSVLFEAPTIRQLSARIERAAGADEHTSGRESSALVTIRSGGEERPFFYVAPYDISVLELEKLARHFPADRPFYGIQPSGLAAGEEIHRTLEEMAAHYIERLRTVQDSGPYALGGHCDGGWIAYEMARQLIADGETVDYLGMVEVPPPYELRGRRDGLAYRLRRAWYFLKDGRLLPALTWQIRKRWEKRFWGTVRGGEQRRVAEVRAAADTAFQAYSWSYDYEGPSHFIQSTEGLAQPVMRGWYDTLAEPGDPTFEVVPSTHARLLMEPEVQSVAKHLVDGLERAEQTT
ncbi:MAG: amino acid adenylation domain-containing protein [Actinomycetota bacterium]